MGLLLVESKDTTHVNLGRIIDVWIDASLENILEMLRVRVLSVRHACEVNVQESRAAVSQ